MNYLRFEEYALGIKHNRDNYSRAKIIELLLEKAQELTGYKQVTIICPKCKGENQYFEIENGYRCAYTDCQHEWKYEDYI